MLAHGEANLNGKFSLQRGSETPAGNQKLDVKHQTTRKRRRFGFDINMYSYVYITACEV